MSGRKIVAVITDALGDRVVIGEKELGHAMDDHFKSIPQDILLELVERVLKDPTEVYRDDRKSEKVYNFFYRIENGPNFLVVVIKVTADGAFFASMYPTGKSVRNAHRNLKKVKL